MFNRKFKKIELKDLPSLIAQLQENQSYVIGTLNHQILVKRHQDKYYLIDTNTGPIQIYETIDSLSDQIKKSLDYRQLAFQLIPEEIKSQNQERHIAFTRT